LSPFIVAELVKPAAILSFHFCVNRGRSAHVGRCAEDDRVRSVEFGPAGVVEIAHRDQLHLRARFLRTGQHGFGDFLRVAVAAVIHDRDFRHTRLQKDDGQAERRVERGRRIGHRIQRQKNGMARRARSAAAMLHATTRCDGLARRLALRRHADPAAIARAVAAA
jgi:hypothetical protein